MRVGGSSFSYRPRRDGDTRALSRGGARRPVSPLARGRRPCRTAVLPTWSPDPVGPGHPSRLGGIGDVSAAPREGRCCCPPARLEKPTSVPVSPQN